MELLSDEEVLENYALSNMMRYNHRLHLQKESVATHSFFVSLFCLKIMAKLNLDNETKLRILILSILHDVPENKTSDIPYDVKQEYPEIRKILEKIEKEYFLEKWPEYANIIFYPTTLEKTILDLADVYSVYQFCLSEIILGNKSKKILEIKEDAVSRINSLSNKLRGIINEQNSKRI